jgi:hypothetical protein
MSLDDLFNDPELADLLGDPKKEKSAVNTELDRLLEIYNSVKEFYEEHGRLPIKSKDFTERQVFSKYNGLINDADSVDALQEYDTLDILPKKEYSSLDDALNDPELASLLDDKPLDLFTLKYVKKYTPPDYIARRKKCDDFTNYEPLFIKCHEDLNSGRRGLLKFNRTGAIEQGKFYVLKGMLCYIASVGHLEKANNRVMDGRILAVFENGTESDLLMESLRRSLYAEHGAMITVPEDEVLDPTMVEDIITGSVYILRSMLDNEHIKSLTNFYKIGFTSEPVKKRISGAENSPTYLYGGVKLVAEYEVRNAAAKGVEKLLHKFFATANLDIEINGCKPREWFAVPLDVIDRAINLVISGQIVYYQYNHETESIELI